MQELLSENSSTKAEHEDDFNYKGVDTFLRIVIFTLTAYLFLSEFFVLIMNALNHDKNERFRIFFMTSLFNIILHYFVMHNVWEATNESILEAKFWQIEAWVALFVWYRCVFSYLSEVRQFSKFIGLIIQCILAVSNFMLVYVCGITAFSDSFHAISQGMYLDDPISNAKLVNINNSALDNLSAWADYWIISFKASLGDFPEDWGQ